MYASPLPAAILQGAASAMFAEVGAGYETNVEVARGGRMTQ